MARDDESDSANHRATQAPVFPAQDWVARLERDRRIVRLRIGGETRYVAVEDAARYRDALGASLPSGLPEALLEPPRDALGDLVARYARSHGPFHAAEVASRFGMGIASVTAVLQALERDGRLVAGEFRPGSAGREWCDAGVFRALRQKSVARVRREVEAVEQPALGRLYLAWQGVSEPRRGSEALLQTIEQLQGAAIPASILESQVLAARLEAYDPHELDALTASGSVIWVGCDPLGQHDGRISLYLTEHVPFLLDPRLGERRPEGPLPDRIREHLSTRGASFFPQLIQACGGAFFREVLDALWDLIWAGEVTNDTLQPLRAALHPRLSQRGPSRHFRPGGWHARGPALAGLRISPPGTPPEAVGRWSLVNSLVLRQPSPTERLAARVHVLLDRHGVLTREAVQAEGIPGGFSGIYGVLRAMEEAGRIRRGYFVAGCGATQFALPGAVERLRALREPAEEMDIIFLAAADPANPYGAALPWPEREQGRRPARMAGAAVILIDGALAACLPARGERQILTFPAQLPERDPEEVEAAIARALAEQVGPGKRRALFVKEVDGQPVADTPMAPALAAAGFTYGPHGFMKRW